MTGISYSVVGLLALFIYGIINHSFFIKRAQSGRDKAFVRFTKAAFVYFFLDALWGVIDALQWDVVLYAVTVADHVSMALTVWFCARYMVVFLDREETLGKVLNIIGCIFCGIELTIVAINFSHSYLFNFDESGQYQPGFYRHMAMAMLIVAFAYISLKSFQVARKSVGLLRKKNLTISLVGLTMTLFMTLQWMFPLWPCYTAGLLLCTLIIRVFIHEEELRAADAAKSAFLYNMSHDIRTPMNAIIGYTELIKKHRNETERCDDYLNKIQTSSHFLLSLINDVLEMARIESGKQTLDETAEPSNTIHTEIADVYGELFRKKGIEFTHSSDIKTPYLYKDSVKLKEIFLNLISNALKYTPEGGRVSLTITELPCEEPDTALIRTTVSDTGIGMSSEFLQVLFEPFSRAKSATESRIEGTGLGMPIVKQLVGLMGGTITVESELGKGTTFVVTLPHRIATDSQIVAKQPLEAALQLEDTKGMRLLLAEDNDFNAEIATEILSEVGIEVERATDGIVCIDMLTKHPSRYYTAILMDIQMPNMDGYKTTQVIRQLTDDRSDIPIIAMTANAFEEDRVNALKAGMNEHLTKPIEIPKLYSALSALVK